MHLTRVTVAPSFAPLSCGALWKSWASVSGEFNKLRARESKRGAVDFCVLIWFLRGNPLKTDHLSLKRFIFSIGGVNFPWKGCYSVASRNSLHVRLICFMYLLNEWIPCKSFRPSNKRGSFTFDRNEWKNSWHYFYSISANWKALTRVFLACYVKLISALFERWRSFLRKSLAIETAVFSSLRLRRI